MQNTDPAIEEREMARDAARYLFLRSKDLDAINHGGVFAGQTPHNFVLNGDDLDEAVDTEMKQLGQLLIAQSLSTTTREELDILRKKEPALVDYLINHCSDKR